MNRTCFPNVQNFWKNFAAASLIAVLLISICVPGLAVLFQPQPAPPVPWCLVTAIENLPLTGEPKQYPLYLTKPNAWETGKPQIIGSVFFRWLPDSNQVVAFSATSPWLGCQLKYDDKRKCFACVCHRDEDYDLLGHRLGSNPAPRDMDRLEVEVRDHCIWLKPQLFTPGTANSEASTPE